MEITSEKIKKMLALKAVCGSNNTLGVRSFGKIDPQKTLKDLELTKHLLQDLSNRLSEVANEPDIKSVKVSLDTFIAKLNENTTYGDVLSVMEASHRIVDPIYWSHSEELGVPHP